MSKAAPWLRASRLGLRRSRYRLRHGCRLLWQAYLLWLRADCVDLSAAFAYHTLQSFFPALLILLSVFSRLLGRDDALLRRIHDQMALLLPASSLPLFEEALQRFLRQGFSAGLLGVVLLVLSANNIYLTLQRGADRLWWHRSLEQPPQAWQHLVRRFLLLRLKAFCLLVLIALLSVLDQLISPLRLFGSRALRQGLEDLLPPAWHPMLNVSGGVDLVMALLIGFLTMLLILWWLPSRPIPLRPLVWPSLLVGASLTALNLLLARVLLAIGLRFQAYGVVGGVLILTLWIWLAGVMLYFGQCLGVVLARTRQGRRSTPIAWL